MRHAARAESGHRPRNSSGASRLRECAPHARLVVVGQRPALVDPLAQALRSRGARVVVAEPTGAGLEAARRLDPHAIVLARAPRQDGVLALLRNDLVLRWAFVIPFRWRAVASDDGEVVDPTPILERADPWVRHERWLLQRLRDRSVVCCSLGLIGPGRVLRALASRPDPFRVEIASSSGRGLFEVEAGMVGARWWQDGGATPRFTGASAVAAFLGADEAWMRIERAEGRGPDAERIPIGIALAWAGERFDDLAHEVPTRPRLRLVTPPPEPPPEPEPVRQPFTRTLDRMPAPSRITREIQAEAEDAGSSGSMMWAVWSALLTLALVIGAVGVAMRWEVEPTVRTRSVAPVTMGAEPGAGTETEPRLELGSESGSESESESESGSGSGSGSRVAPNTGPAPVAAWATSDLPPLSLLRAAGQRLPRNPRAARVRSDALLDEARAADDPGPILHRAFVAGPQNPHAAAALARWHLSEDRHEVALAYARWAARQRRANAPYRWLAADALEAMGRRAEARAEREAAVRLDPTLADGGGDR